MAGGRTRWIAAAARDVEDAARQIREVEVLRAIAADEAAAAVGLDPNPSLSALAAAADEPWASILTEHREALMVLSDEIIKSAATNRSLISAAPRRPRNPPRPRQRGEDLHRQRRGRGGTHPLRRH